MIVLNNWAIRSMNRLELLRVWKSNCTATTENKYCFEGSCRLSSHYSYNTIYNSEVLGKSVRNCVIGFLLEANNALPRKSEIERVDMFPITSSLGDGPFRGVVSLPTPCSIIPYPSLKLFQHLLDFTRYLFHFTIYEPYFSDCFAYYIRLIGKLWFCVVVLYEVLYSKNFAYYLYVYFTC